VRIKTTGIIYDFHRLDFQAANAPDAAPDEVEKWGSAQG
jgi:hypothetical protein